MASIRSLVRDENAQVGFHSKSGAQARANGPSKGLKFKGGLETPRRALGDVGNIFKTPGNVAEKTSMLKTINQQQILKASKQKIKATPLGSHKQKSSVKTTRKDILGDRDFSNEKEKMIPFVDVDKPLPRSDAVKTILQNVSHLYQGCIQPSYKMPLFIDKDEKFNLEDTDRFQEPPNSSSAFSWLPHVDDSFFEVSKLHSGLDDLELPPVDTDLSGLGLP